MKHCLLTRPSCLLSSHSIPNRTDGKLRLLLHTFTFFLHMRCDVMHFVCCHEVRATCVTEKHLISYFPITGTPVCTFSQSGPHDTSKFMNRPRHARPKNPFATQCRRNLRCRRLLQTCCTDWPGGPMHVCRCANPLIFGLSQTGICVRRNRRNHEHFDEQAKHVTFKWVIQGDSTFTRYCRHQQATRTYPHNCENTSSEVSASIIESIFAACAMNFSRDTCWSRASV